MPKHRYAPTAAVMISVASLSGCTSPENDRLVVGPVEHGPVTLHAFEPATIDIDAVPANDPPSLDGISRDHWGAQTFVVPVDTTVHAPRWVWFDGYPGDTHRDTGAFPTAITALDGPHSDGGLRAAETVAGATWAVLEAIAFPVRLFIDPQHTDRRSPTTPYARTPGGAS